MHFVLEILLSCVSRFLVAPWLVVPPSIFNSSPSSLCLSVTTAGTRPLLLRPPVIRLGPTGSSRMPALSPPKHASHGPLPCDVTVNFQGLGCRHNLEEGGVLFCPPEIYIHIPFDFQQNVKLIPQGKENQQKQAGESSG